MGGELFDATLSGDQEDPPVETDATGTFSMTLEDGVLPYSLAAQNIVDVTAVHLHVDPDDGLGPAVAFPFAVNGEGEGGPLADGTLTAADLIGPLAGQTIADLVAIMEAGNAYVNVHTKANPGGEIRGPIIAVLPVIGPGPELLGTLSLNAGGQFGPHTADHIFADVKIAWLFNATAVSWTSFIPLLGVTNFALFNGAVLWVVSNTAQEIQVFGATEENGVPVEEEDPLPMDEVDEPTVKLDCETQIGEGVPEFYSRYFRCVQIELDGDSVRITSDNLPPHPSFYYGEGHALFEAFDSSRGADYRANPNVIGGRGFVLRIPLEPVEAGLTIDATTVNTATGDATDYPLGTAGAALNGVALFNPLARPGDDIADEKFTFDGYEGHPQQTGDYHYHAVSPGPLAVLQALGFTTSTIPGAADIELYGIMCDGTVVMGLVELDGSAVAAGLDVQGGHTHDLVDGDGTVLLTNRYHVHIAAEIGFEPRGLTPEAQYYEACVVS